MSESIKTIKGKKLFSDIFQTGKKVHTEFINAIYVLNKSEHNNFKFAVAVSKKNSKKAVLRNRIKRLLRESIRHYWSIPENMIFNLEYIILIWRKPIKGRFDFSYEEINRHVNILFKEIEGKSVK